jgi:hypothetical protein
MPPPTHRRAPGHLCGMGRVTGERMQHEAAAISAVFQLFPADTAADLCRSLPIFADQGAFQTGDYEEIMPGVLP